MGLLSCLSLEARIVDRHVRILGRAAFLCQRNQAMVLIRRPDRVAEERKERGDTHTLVMQPDGHPGDVSSRPVKRDWSLARIWLFRHLNPDHPPPIDRADSEANDQDYT
jgi:hypothetical protein